MRTSLYLYENQPSPRLVPSLENNIMKYTRSILSVGLLLSFSAPWLHAAEGQTNLTPYTLTTFAGLAPGNPDGVGSAARFYFPNGVAVDGASNVYVADTYYNTIRKITPAGSVTTVAGGHQ